MAPESLKAAFGGQVAFHGGIDMQRLLPRGTPAEVAAEARRYRRSSGRAAATSLAPRTSSSRMFLREHPGDVSLAAGFCLNAVSLRLTPARPPRGIKNAGTGLGSVQVTVRMRRTRPGPPAVQCHHPARASEAVAFSRRHKPCTGAFPVPHGNPPPPTPQCVGLTRSRDGDEVSRTGSGKLRKGRGAGVVKYAR